MSDRMRYGGRNADRYAKKQYLKKRDRFRNKLSKNRKGYSDDFQKRRDESY